MTSVADNAVKIVKQASLFRLIVIPLTVVAAWLIETFLLEKNLRTFAIFNGENLLLYTIFACILTGIVIPVLLIVRSFRTGDVNMFQIGFRTPKRTLAACAVAFFAGYCAILLAGPPASGRLALVSAFLVFLPTGIASAVVCWVLAGTHIQAAVRRGGIIVSIPAGVIITGILFGLSSAVHSFSPDPQTLVSRFIGAGIIAAFFFFAIRDVYATAVIVTFSDMILAGGGIDPAYFAGLSAWIIVPAVLALGTLLCIHWYLFTHFTTIQVPVPLQKIPGTEGAGKD